MIPTTKLIELNYRTMTKIFKKFGIVLAILPVLSTGTIPSINLSSSTDSTNTIQIVRQSRADAIDSFYKTRSMPLAGQGMNFVLVSEKYGLDWRLLPSIAIRESSGGKADINNNPFGWGSCKIKFKDYNESIDIVGKNLGGANQKTSRYYAGKSSYDKLYAYNGTVLASYPDEVINIMKMISSKE